MTNHEYFTRSSPIVDLPVGNNILPGIRFYNWAREKQSVLAKADLPLTSKFQYLYALRHILGKLVLDVGSAGFSHFANLINTNHTYYHCDRIPIKKVDYPTNYFQADARNLPPEAVAGTITALWFLHDYPTEASQILTHLRSRCRCLILTVDYNIPNITTPRKTGFSDKDLKSLFDIEPPLLDDLVITDQIRHATLGITLDGDLSPSDLQNAEEGLRSIVGKVFCPDMSWF